MSEERGNVDKESFAVSSQECLLSSSDEAVKGWRGFCVINLSRSAVME